MKEASDEARKAAHRRFQDAVLALTKAFALAAASDEARAIRDDICHLLGRDRKMTEPESAAD